MTETELTRWLDAYGRAWERRDAETAVALFTADVEYYETPFDPPFRGLDEVRAYWAGATGTQRDVHFRHQPVAVAGPTCIARWHADFVRIASERRVELDGVLILTFAGDGRCAVLREWWHTARAGDD